MKKVLSPISVVLALLILISTALPLTASAAADDQAKSNAVPEY